MAREIRAVVFDVGETLLDESRSWSEWARWLEVSDPESWEVSADNVLMRLALRSGLVPEGDVDQVRGSVGPVVRQPQVCVLPARLEVA